MKLLPEQVATRARSRSAESTGTGRSGTIGGRIFSIGLAPASSPSSASQPKSCCSDRNRTDAVDGERDSIRCVMKSATWSRVTSSTSWSGCKLW